MNTIYQVSNLIKNYPVPAGGFFKKRQKYISAVDNVSFEIKNGETFGIVGESGSGKTTLARLLLRLIEPTEGKIIYKNQEITKFNRKEMKNIRKDIQMIFQDPFSSLDPRKTILNIIAEPLIVHKLNQDISITRKVKDTLELVDLPSSDDFLKKIPEEISGGQRQRVGIARALVINPEFVVADEPVSMLDASVKAGVISLMMRLKEEIGLTYVFITHELALAYHICDRIAVMYLGEIVEIGDTSDVIHTPIHPYTKLLIDSIPPLTPDKQWNETSFGQSSLTASTSGCKFFERCNAAEEACKGKSSDLKEVKRDHFSACWKFQ